MRKRWAGDQTHGSQKLSHLRGGSGGTTGRPLPCATLRCGSNQWWSFYNLPWVGSNLFSHLCLRPKTGSPLACRLELGLGLLAPFLSHKVWLELFYWAASRHVPFIYRRVRMCRETGKSKPPLFRGGLGRGLNIRNASPKRCPLHSCINPPPQPSCLQQD